jgi:hypothetical protein
VSSKRDFLLQGKNHIIIETINITLKQTLGDLNGIIKHHSEKHHIQSAGKDQK